MTIVCIYYELSGPPDPAVTAYIFATVAVGAPMPPGPRGRGRLWPVSARVWDRWQRFGVWPWTGPS